MTADEMATVVDLIAANPRAGEVIEGSGGCRKIRVAGKGRGKSRGYRVVTFLGGNDVPAFLLAVLSKGSRASFSAAERNAMARVAKRLVESLSE